MNILLNVLCFQCRKRGNHFYLPIIFKGEGFYSCDPMADRRPK